MKNIKYVAGILSCGLALSSLASLIQYFSIINLIYIVGFVLITIALFSSKLIISAIGYGLLASERLVFFIKNIEHIADGKYPQSLVISGGIIGLYFFLLLVASINAKSSKVLGIVASVFALFAVVLIKVRSPIEGYILSSSTYPIYAIYIIFAILFGITCSINNNTTQSRVINRQNSGIVENNTERLLKLKDLLDEGIITQEEFDAKKKEILNL